MTPEDRARAARKYGLIEEDYEPMGVVGMGNYGDYPKLKSVGWDERDSHHNWDLPWLKRDFGEPMDYEFYMYQGTRCDTGRKIVPPWLALCYFLLIYTCFALVHYYSPEVRYPLMNVQKPGDGKKHYTFEMAD